MDGWNDLFVANAGASATLAGLMFVGLSINLDKLVKMPGVLLRAAASLALLTSVLGLSILLLIPDQSVRNTGIEVLGVTIADMVIVGFLSLRSIQRTATLTSESEDLRRCPARRWATSNSGHGGPQLLHAAGCDSRCKLRALAA